MSMIDRQRIAAVATLEALGYVFQDGVWTSPLEGPLPVSWIEAADAMHQLLVKRMIGLDSREGSPTAAEYAEIAEVLEAYEEKCWPDE